MSEILEQLTQPGPFEPFSTIALCFLIYVALGLLPAIGVTYLVYFLVTLPLRRNERGRLFIDLLEVGLQSGHTPERIIMDVSSSHDLSLGARFHLLAAHLERGLRLTAALDCVPRLLPPQIVAILKTGERIGDVRRVLPACRYLLRDPISQVRGAMNYLVLLAFLVSPVAVAIPLLLRIKVIPTFRAVFEGMLEGGQLPAFTRFVFASDSAFFFIQVTILVLIWLAAFVYLGGPRLRSWFNFVAPGAADAVAFRLPWRRKRLHRDFSAMLAVLLDSSVPESEAIQLAAEATVNESLSKRAQQVRARLEQGVKLPEAILALDDSRELHWRLTTALKRTRGFMSALSGWHEALDASAFQSEQAAAQLTTTALVLINGAVVASVVIGMFLPLIDLLRAVAL
jgi:type II secretory pathway component PulF